MTDSILNGRSYFETGRTVDELEQCLRILAGERRTWRRALAESILTVIERSNVQKLSARVIAEDKSTDGSTGYVFLALVFPVDIDLHTYRQARLAWLEKYCTVAKLLLPNATKILGIATEHKAFNGNRSEDLILIDASKWTKENEEEAKRIQREEHVLENTEKFGGTYKEFPVSHLVSHLKSPMARDRKERACPCGSGKKYKKCHGRSR